MPDTGHRCDRVEESEIKRQQDEGSEFNNWEVQTLNYEIGSILTMPNPMHPGYTYKI